MFPQVAVDHSNIGSYFKGLLEYVVIDSLNDKRAFACRGFPGGVDESAGQRLDAAGRRVNSIKFQDSVYHLVSTVQKKGPFWRSI